MNQENVNQWAERFLPLMDRETLKQRAQIIVEPLLDLHQIETELACKRLEISIGQTFYPTNQCLDVLQRMVGMAYAHCITTYPNIEEFLSGVYSKKVPLDDFTFPMLITGLAGTGKSELLKTFMRIQLDEGSVDVGHDHSPFPLKQPWGISVRVKSNPSDIFKELAQTDKGSAELVEVCRKIAFRDGIPLLSIDEFQFLTGSSSANTKLTQLLLSIGYLGIPWVYCANFSLVQRLLKRPEEDSQRLLSNYLVLLPDTPSSEDWGKTLSAIKAVAPDILTFDPTKDASDIHMFTAGRKRAVKKLLIETLRDVHSHGGLVDINSLERIYHSSVYARYRVESEIIRTQAILNRPDRSRTDLWCPIPLAEGAETKFAQAAKDSRDASVANAELRSALNGEEKAALKEIEKVAKRAKKPKGEVVQFKKNAPTTDQLKQNSARFRDMI